MVDLSKVPTCKFAPQGADGSTPTEQILGMFKDAISRKGAVITQGFEMVNGVQWCNSIAVKFPIPSGEDNV